jgi:hypothetical protein
VFHHLQVEDVPEAAFTQSAGRDNCGNAGIHGEKTLQRKGAEALSHLPPDKAILKMEAAERPLLTQSLPDSIGDGVGQRGHRKKIRQSREIANQELAGMNEDKKAKCKRKNEKQGASLIVVG